MDCIYHELCSTKCTENCNAREKPRQRKMPDIYGNMEYTVETSYPYIFVKCASLTQAKRAKAKIRKEIGRVSTIVAVTENGNDYIFSN
ncbi:MAG TPA: hypothetical protein DCW90_17965 [Lachnospiraceae bacterium]|nr:hypothetical protein [Lachnospiraceae bacterium]